VAIVTPFVQVGTYPTRNFATLGPFVIVTRRVIFYSSGAGISAALCMLPCSPDYIIRLISGGLACSL
jgi:hypothetical protein